MYINTGFADLKKTIVMWRLWTLLGWLEIRQRYARSKLGPFWLTISMGILVGTMGVVYGTLFGQNLSEYLPRLAIGIVVWNLFSSIVIECSNVYISSHSYIKQIPAPKLIYVFQVIWRNLAIFLHNSVIVVLVLFLFDIKNFQLALISIFSLLLLIINAAWIGAIFGIISARFRDFPQIVNSSLQVLFYITPIIFERRMLGSFDWIAKYNPLAHLIDLTREPLMGVLPGLESWFVVMTMATVGWSLLLYFIGKYGNRIPFWV